MVSCTLARYHPPPPATTTIVYTQPAHLPSCFGGAAPPAHNCNVQLLPLPLLLRRHTWLPWQPLAAPQHSMQDAPPATGCPGQEPTCTAHITPPGACRLRGTPTATATPPADGRMHCCQRASKHMHTRVGHCAPVLLLLLLRFARGTSLPHHSASHWQAPKPHAHGDLAVSLWRGVRMGEWGVPCSAPTQDKGSRRGRCNPTQPPLQQTPRSPLPHGTTTTGMPCPRCSAAATTPGAGVCEGEQAAV